MHLPAVRGMNKRIFFYYSQLYGFINMVTICNQVKVCSNSKRDFNLKQLKRFTVTLYLFVTSLETIVVDHDCHAGGSSCLFQDVGLSSCWLTVTPVPAANHYRDRDYAVTWRSDCKASPSQSRRGPARGRQRSRLRLGSDLKIDTLNPFRES
jgi:hypothetical protein